MRGRLGDEADDAGRRRGEVRRAPAPLPRARGASWARPPTTCPGVPGVGPATRRQVDQPVRRPRQRRSTSADEITGKKGEALREHLGDVIRNRQLNALVRDLDLPLTAGRPGAAAVGPPGGAHALRRPGVPGAARPALRDPRVRGGDRRLRLRARHDPARAGRGRRGWLAEHAHDGRQRVGVTSQGSWRAGHRRRADRCPSPTADGTAAARRRPR